MADNNQLKASRIDFDHDDPFAELTRIMGFDPREPVRKPEPAPSPQPAAPQQQTPASFAQPAEEDDFSLDLEKELLGGFDFEDEPAQPAFSAGPAAPEQDDFLPQAAEPDFDFAADFDAALASESSDAPVQAPESSRYDDSTAPAPLVEDDFDLGLSDEDMQGLGAFEAAPAAGQADDLHLDLASALSDFGTERSASPQAEAATQQPAAVEAEEFDLGFFDETDFQLADEVAPQAEPLPSTAFEEPLFELPEEAAPEARAEAGAEPEFDASAFQFSDDEFRFDDLPAVGSHDADPALPVEDQPAADVAFGDIDFGDEFGDDDARHDDLAAPVQDAPAPQAVEPAAAPATAQPFEFSVPAFVPRKLPTSPMDVAAEEFRQREAVAVPQPEFNLEDELNALLGNSKQKATPEPVPLPTAPAAVQNFEASRSAALQPASAPAAAPVQFDAPEHPVELDDSLNWEFDDSFAAEAAPEETESDSAEPYETAGYDAEDDLALDLDDVFDEIAETEREPEPPYRETFAGTAAGIAAGAAAGAAARAAPAFAARPFEVPPFQPAPSYNAAASGRQASVGQASTGYASMVSSHRDPVVRGDPLKEDPLNVITQLAEQYSRKEPVSYGRAAGAAAASGYGDEEVEDDLDISYDFDDQPEIDTIEVTDRAVALADDFDIPELPEEDHVPQAAAYDDIDAEFSSLLNELNAEQQAAQPASGYSDPLAGGFHAQPYQAAPAAKAYAQRPTASAAPPRDLAPEQDAFSLDMDAFADTTNGGQDQGGMHYADDYQFENEFDQEMMPGHLAEENSRRPIPRKFLIGGLIAGVALIGGLGAFAFSYGGGGSGGAPELVRAEDGPVKVRPENPGGTTVPNQENKVYERVAGEGNTNGSGQESLVTTAEEPLDVTPPADDENIAASGKSEERIEQILQDTEGQSDAELAAVAPRKVRTMVVKPDGTLVEREVEPGTSNEQTDTIPAAGATQDVPALAPVPGETQVAAAPPAPETTGSTPDTAPIAPLRPAEQPVDVVGEVKPDQVAAATTAAAAAGTWAMQIASQPSEAAAQSSYQDLARRYGNVLQGREVNIVKAEIAGKGTFWRVRVPAPTRNEAITLCEQYKAAGGNCFVSR